MELALYSHEEKIEQPEPSGREPGKLMFEIVVGLLLETELLEGGQRGGCWGGVQDRPGCPAGWVGAGQGAGHHAVNTTVNTRSTQRSTSFEINELLRA